MFIRTFRNYRTEILFRLPFWAIFLWAFAFTTEQNFYYPPSSPLFDYLSGIITQNALLNKAIAFLIVLFSAYLLSYVINYHQLLPSKSYLPAFFYVLFLSYKPELLDFNRIILLNLVYILVFDQLFRTYKKELADNNIFNAGFLCGIAGLIFLSASGMLLVVFISLIILRTPSLREWLVAIIAFLVPFIYFVSYYFFTDRFVLVFYIFKEELIFKGFSIFFDGKLETILEFTLWGFFILSILFYLFRKTPQLIVSQYTNSVIVLFILFAAAIGYAFEQNACFADFAIPASLLISHFVLQVKKISFVEFLLWCIVLLIIATHYEEQIFVFLNLK